MGSVAFSCNRRTICYEYDGEYWCDEDFSCEFIEFHQYNSTHVYAFSDASCDYMFFIVVRYYSYERDKMLNTWMVIALVEENATLEQVMNNLYIV